jgi:hypothetical protein
MPKEKESRKRKRREDDGGSKKRKRRQETDHETGDSERTKKPEGFQWSEAELVESESAPPFVSKFVSMSFPHLRMKQSASLRNVSRDSPTYKNVSSTRGWR